jgi:hypothetical protein
MCYLIKYLIINVSDNIYIPFVHEVQHGGNGVMSMNSSS